MKNRFTSYVLALAILLAFTPTLSAQHAPKAKVDLGAFTKEIMMLDFGEGQTHLAMWLPFEFFVAAALSEGNSTRASAEQDLDFLKPYITLVVQGSYDRPDGTSVYATEKEIRARAVLVLADGTTALPLEKVPPKVSAIMAAMKAAITSEGDASSANLHIVVFPALTAAGKKIVDSSQKAKLTLLLKDDAKFKERTFTWRTPFDSVVAVPECPRCKAGVSAKWTYCPYCGQKLPE